MAFNQEQFLKEQQAKAVNLGGFDIDAFVKQRAIPVSTKLDTPEGLQRRAEQVGLEQKAQRVLAQKGEDPKKIFSGGFISDIFDGLNALQYGVTGLLKGKGFAEGVRTRQSFSDKDALGDFGIPGLIGGIALDIAVDPLTYIAPWTVFKKIGLAPKIVKGAKALEQTRAGDWLARKVVYMHGADPVWREMYEKSVKNIAVAGQNLTEMVRPISKLTPNVAKTLLKKDATGRFIRTPLESLQKTLDPETFANVQAAYAKLDDLGREAVDLKLLSPGKFEENVGQYIKTAFTEFEQSKKKGFFGFAKLGIQGIKPRKQLTPEKLKELGQIDNPAYLFFKSMADLTKDIENAKLFRGVSKAFASDVAKDGYTKLKDTRRLGEVSGKYVPNNIAEYINEIVKPREVGFGKKIVAGFKFAKVIMNPATHARNIASNQVLNWWKLGMNPLDPRTIDAQRLAIKEIARGGKYVDEAKTVGYNLNTFASQEISALLDSPEAIAGFGKARSLFSKTRKALGDIYQGEENFAKLSAFIFNRKTRGMPIEEAWKAAESATFNYAQVTPFVRKLRESLFGFPFITFTVKATPIAAETAAKAPGRISVFGKAKQAIENQSDIEVTARERAAEPAWVRDGFYVKLPMKDQHGRSAYFDLTYILPFGDIMSGQFFTRQVSRETGLKESLVETGLEKSPFLNVVKELFRNQDFFGDKIFRESDTTDQQLKDVSRYIFKVYTPPLIGTEIPGGYKSDGTRRQKGFTGALTPADEIKQQRTLMQELLRNVGAKIQPIDVDIQETFANWEKQKALETLLEENQAVKEFNRFYVPR